MKALPAQERYPPLLLRNLSDVPTRRFCARALNRAPHALMHASIKELERFGAHLECAADMPAYRLCRLISRAIGLPRPCG